MRVKKRAFKTINAAEAAVKNVGVDNKIRKIMAEKTFFQVIEIKDIGAPAANILKQIAISRGTDAVVHRDVVVNDIEKSTVLLPGTLRELRLISKELKKQPFGLSELGDKILEILKEGTPSLSFSIMGVLNITPDSFSDGGNYFKKKDAGTRFKELIGEGANIVDVGAESSRPGSERITAEEELDRLQKVFPFFEKSPVPISIDTYKSEVAEIALSRGAEIVNDISALRMDKKMVDIVRNYNARIVLMHMKGTPESMQKEPYYDDVISEIKDFFEERVDFCLSNGIEENKIILDPGIGFGKRLVDNLLILSSIEEFTSYGLPVLIGTSRKSFIGRITGEKVNGRLAGSLATAVYSYLKGVSILRVHDVRETKNALSVVSAVEEER